MNLKTTERKRFPEAGYLGIFELISCRGNRSVSRFVDKFDVCKYFPGYIRNKEIWDKYKNCNISNEHMNVLCNESLKHNKTVFDY